MKKEVKGITLVALVITIIVLLILAGVSIAMLAGESGILRNAEKAIGKSENAQIQENTTLADYENKIGEYVGGTREEPTNAKIFIDTSRVIATVAQSPTWTTESYSYTATEDCAILGRVGSINDGQANIFINSVNIGQVRNSTGLGYSTINYYIKKGDIIEIRALTSATDSGIYAAVYAYGLK